MSKADYKENLLNLTDSEDLGSFRLDKLCRSIAAKADQFQIGLLPDAHFKPQLESPSSAVFALKDYFSLHLTSPSPNCGISLLRTGFSEQELNTDEFLNTFFTDFKQKVPLSPRDKKLNTEQVSQVLAGGASALCSILGIDPEVLNSIELAGNVFEEPISMDEINSIIPEFIRNISEYRIGILGGGNHFLEFQTVDEVYDNHIAQQLKIEFDQAMIMFHTGSEAVGSLIGRMFAHREKTPLKMSLKLFPEKLKFHLRSGAFTYPLQKLAYFLPSRLHFQSDTNYEGARALKAYHAAFNFGYANRLVLTDTIRKIFKNHFSLKDPVNLLFDVSHNSIFKEEYEAKEYYFHRHNSCRILPRQAFKEHQHFTQTGQPIILPGTNQHASYLCVAGDHPEKSLHTIDHGFGKLILKNRKQDGIIDSKHSTKLYHYQKDTYEQKSIEPESVCLQEIRRLEDMGIIKLVAKLRPFATLKGPKAKYT